MSVSAHLRGIVIAGGLAALALALAFITLVMNQTASPAATHTVLPLKDRHHGTSSTAKGSKTGTAAKPKRVDPNLQAALAGGLPRSIAEGLAKSPVVVVELTTASDPVATLALGEARAGAALGGASFVSVNVDHNGGDIQALTRLLDAVPVAPAALVYQRPASLYVTLPGFNDRTTVQQAAANALLTAAGTATSTTTLTAAPAWASRASVLCRQTSTKITALGGMASPAKLATKKTQFEAVAAGFVAQLNALKAPTGRVAAVRQLSALFTKSFAAEDAEVSAVALHNPAALRAARGRAAALRPKITKLDRQLGASSCSGLAA